MLFLGTKKYPEADFDTWLGKNSGYSNASTSQCFTKYYFETSNEALEEAIDRFSQFFIAPLFNADLTNKELNAVNQEHQKNLLNDDYRQWQLFTATSKPNQPMAK